MNTRPTERPPGFMSRDQFRVLLACLHPDRTASPERLAEMFDTIKKAEAFLVVPDRRPTDLPDLTIVDLWQRKEAVKRARAAKRTAAKAAKGAA